MSLRNIEMCICRKCGRSLAGWAVGTAKKGWEHIVCPDPVKEAVK